MPKDVCPSVICDNKKIGSNSLGNECVNYGTSLWRDIMQSLKNGVL